MSSSDVDQWADAGLKALQQGTAEQVRASVSQALPVNPDTEAQTRRDAAAAQVPLVTARALPDVTKVQAQMSGFDADIIARQFPTTAQLLAHPDLARIAHDDIPKTTQVEQTTTALAKPQGFVGPPDATLIQRAQTPDFWTGIAKYIFSANPGKDNLTSDIGSAANTLGSKIGETAALAAGSVGMAADAGHSAITGKLHTEMQDAAFGVAKPYTDIVDASGQAGANDAFHNKLVKSAATLGLQLPMMLAAGGGAAIDAAASGTETLAHYLGNAAVHGAKAMALPALTDATDMMRHVYEKTGDLAAAARAGQAQFALATAGGIVPLNAPGALMARLGTGSVVGALQGELSRQGMNAVLPDSMQTPYDPEESALSAVTGGLTAGAMGPHSPGNRAAAVRAFNEAFEVAKTEGQNAQVVALGKAAATSKLRERDPEAFKQFVKATVDQADAPKGLFVDAHELNAILLAHEVTPGELHQTMPDVAAQLQSAMGEMGPTNGLVRIPIEDFATHIAGSPLEEPLLQHFRVTPDGGTVAESEAYHQSQVADLKTQAERLTVTNAGDQAYQDSLNRVTTDIHARLEAIGMKPDVAVTNAAPLTAFYQVHADRLGVLPHEFADRYPVNFSNKAFDGLDQAAYHGTPHEVSKFTIQKIGTGEGAQAYGWGMYFAKSKDIAEFYRKALSTHETTVNGKPLTPDHPHFATAMSIAANGHAKHLADTKLAIEKGFFEKGYGEKQLAEIEALKGAKIESKQKGNLYKVEVPEDHQMLDYHARMKDQSPTVVAALRKLGVETESAVITGKDGSFIDTKPTLAEAQRAIKAGNLAATATMKTSDMTGAMAYKLLSQKLGGAEAASRALNEAGVPGLRYLDAGSRGDKAETKNQNFVVFDDSHVGTPEAVLNQAMSTRVPTTKKNPENALGEMPLFADLATMKTEPEKLAQNVALLEKYPGLHLTGTDEQKLAQFVDHVKNNLLFLHDSVAPDTRARSKLWYDGARKIVDQWAPKYGVSDSQMSGMLAVLSPQKDWFMNVSLAKRVADVMHDHQDTVWDDKMTETASRIFAKDQYAKDVAAIKGKTLGELDDLVQKAMWIRAHDETHSDRGHDIVSPEGDFVGPKLTQKGVPTKTGWGSLGEIAKAVSIMLDGTTENISAQLGGMHKVRNFYNNIFDPNSEHGFATIDTHAVAAGLLRPLSGSSPEVSHNFGSNEKGQPGPAGSAKTGLSGTYAIYHEAYKLAAAERGVLPREMQSITWEAVRGLFKDTFKSQQGNLDAIDKIWNAHKAGEITLDEARRQVVERAGGIDNPDWLGSDPGAHEEARPAADAGGVPEVRLPGRGAEPAASGDRSQPAGRADLKDKFAQGRDLAPDALSTGKPLTGLPETAKVDGKEVTFGPFAPAHEAAQAYAEKAGIAYEPPRVYTKVDPERARRIAAAFEAMKHDPSDPGVKAAYAAMIDETLAQYETVLKTGLKVEFNGGKDPYGNPRNAILDATRNNHLFVFSTREGFGSDAAFDPKGNPLLAETKHTDANGVPMLANDVFRVVHDYFGHIKDGVGFRADGEENAWRSHAAMYSPEARRAMTTETRGQNSWVNFGPHAEKNKDASGTETVYADQKIGLLPEWASTEGMRDPTERATVNIGLDVPGGGKLSANEAMRVLREAGVEVHGNAVHASDTEQTLVAELSRRLTDHEADTVSRALGQEAIAQMSGDQGSMHGPEKDKWGAFNPAYFLKLDGQRAAFAQESRGTFSPSSKTISVLKGADLSTFQHELGHFFLDTMTHLAAAPDAPASVKADMATLLKWFDVPDLQTWDRMTLDEQRESHEKFATGWETYLMRGDAPTLELRTLFQRFRSWMLNVYKSLKGAPGEFTPEVKGVFDRMIASQDAIDQAEQARRYMPLFDTPEKSGLSAEDWTAYQALGKDATEKAVEALVGKSLKDMAWMDRLRTASLKSVTREAREQRKAIENEVKAEVLSKPVYRAWSFLTGKDSAQLPDEVNAEHKQAVRDWSEKRTEHEDEQRVAVKAAAWEAAPESKATHKNNGLAKGQWLAKNRSSIDLDIQKAMLEYDREHPKPATPAKPDTASKDPTTGAGKLNRDALKSAFGEEVAAKLYEMKMTGKKGIDPGTVADMFGFPDAASLVKALVESEPPQSVVEGMSDQRMLERHGEVADPQAMSRTADELVHNEVRARFVATEFKALKKATGSPKDIVAAAKEAAGNAIDARRVRDIAASQYDSAETRSAKQAERAMSKGDTAGAAIAKRDQILNMELARAAREAQAFVTKAVEYLKKFDKPSVREAIDLEYRDQIDALLDRADLRKSVTNTALDKREALQSFVERMSGAGYKPQIPEHLLDEAERWHYKDMPLAAFKGLVDAVKSIEHLGKMKSKLLDAKETREISDLADEVKESAGKLPQRPAESNRGLTRMEQKWISVKALGRSAEASLLKMEQMLDWLDARNPNGTLNRVVFRRLSEAGVHENNLLSHVKSEIDKLMDANLADITKERGKIYVATDLIDGKTGLPQRFTTKEMLMLAGNMGNASNAAKMAKGERWNEADVWAFLHTNMTKAHWDFVAGMGRTLESLWPEKLAMDRRLGNTSPEKIEPRPFDTPHGKYEGWYWPLMYDPARSQDVAERGARQGDAMFENIYAKANTDTGRMNTRNENYARPLLLDLDALPRMIKDEIHDVSHREAIIDADRFLSHPTVRKAIVSALSQEHYDQLRPWLQSIANDGKTSTDGARGMEFFNTIAREARMRATMVGLGLRLTTALVHGSTAAVESVSELGPRWMASGLKDFANPMQWAANKDFVFERSGEMRNRMNEVDRDVREHLREIDLKLMDPATGAVQRGADLMRAHAYSLIAGLDMASALPTWMGAYKKAMSPVDRGGLGYSEIDSVQFADKTVRNAHGGTGIKDMARVQRGTEFQKLFTMFYTFWNHNANRIQDTAKLVMSSEHRAMLKEQNNWTSTQLATTVILRTLAYTFGVQALHSMINPPKKDDGEEGWLKWAGKEFLASAFAGIPIARDISAHYMSGKDYSVTPAASMVDAVGRTGQDAANALTGKEVSDKWLKHAITTAGYATGLPLGQPASTAQFLWDLAEGKQHPESAKDWWNGIAHGDVKAHH